MLKNKILYRWMHKKLNGNTVNTNCSTNTRLTSITNSSTINNTQSILSNTQQARFCWQETTQEKQFNYYFFRKMSSETQTRPPKFTNRLATSKSPYLLQHAHNPVDWYPWCEEAFQRARQENKLIFLSVGYSTCHWCHVMEHESFENEDVAALMNYKFINIKVDREERPDIDKIYMQFLLMTTGNGGWPMSVWLTPDLTPIMAGTYFPPNQRWGMPSFVTVLENISSKWETDRDSLRHAGSALIDALQKSATGDKQKEDLDQDSIEAKFQEAILIYKQRFDQQHGGFNTQPKFPEVPRLNFIFHSYIITKNVDLLDMVLHTLDNMGRGGINDHVFGGFARYAVDKNWHVPHFEKMLYDQGQLMSAYANAYKLTNGKQFLEYANNIYRYIVKDLRHPAGGFYAGEDADSLPTHRDTVKVEGAFYAWTWTEIKDIIKQNAKCYNELSAENIFEIYAAHYGIQPNGNVKASSDPHGHLTNKNILIVHGSVEATCDKFDISEQQLGTLLKTTNELLHEVRDKRPRPHLDTKIICSWNGLVLSGLSKLANCGTLRRAEYLKAAKDLVSFARAHFYDAERKVLLRSCYGIGIDNELLSKNDELIDGFLDDYAFLIKGLLDYYKASLDCSVLHWAKELQDIQDVLFWDEANFAYYFSQANAPNIILRMKEDHDGAEPSGNSVAARNLILLSHYYDDESYRQRAEKLLKYFSDTSLFGYALPELMSALLLHDRGLDLVAVVGPESTDTQRFVEICRKFYIPGMIILHVNPQHPDAACNQRIQSKFKMINGRTTVYICHDRVCQMPVTDPEKLEENLKENFFRKEI